MSQPINLFFSYSHDDAEYLDRIKEYVCDGMCADLKIWDDKAIPPGAKWDDEIKNKLKAADIILLLVSRSFLNSVYINEVELKYALDKEKNKLCTVIPIFVRTCPLKRPIELQISSIQGYPRNNERKRTFLSEMEEDIYTHLTDIYNGILDAVENIKKKRETNATSTTAGKTKEHIAIIEKLQNDHKVFLALPGSEGGLKIRNQFFYSAKGKIDYENWPFEVVPDLKHTKSLPEVEAFSRDSVRQHINESTYTLHIINSAEEMAQGIVKDQLQWAREKNEKALFSRSIIWLKSEEMKEMMDPDLRGNPIVVGADIEMVFEIIEDLEIQRKQKLKEYEGMYMSPSLKTIMIYDFTKDHDNTFRKEIKMEIEKTKLCSVRLNAPDETVEKLKEGLSKCHGAIIVYGGSDTPWYLYRQDLLYEAQFLKSKAICVGNPGIEEKIKSDVTMNEFIVIREDAGISEIQKSVEIFLNKLSA